MSEIIAHPWMSQETPGVLFYSAPTIHDLARPFASVGDIDPDVLESLSIICGRHQDVLELQGDLLSPPGEGAFAKAFYYLLVRHRERTLKENGIRMDIDGLEGKTVTKQYVRPASRATLEAHAEMGEGFTPRQSRPGRKAPPTSPLPPIPPYAAKRHLSVDGSAEPPRSRAPSPLGPRAQKYRPASTPLDAMESTAPSLLPPLPQPRYQADRASLLPTRPRAPLRSRTQPAPTPAEYVPDQLMLPEMPLYDSPVQGYAPFAPVAPASNFQYTPYTPPSSAYSVPSSAPPTTAIFAPTPVRPGQPGALPAFAHPVGNVPPTIPEHSLDQISMMSSQIHTSRFDGPERRGSRPFGARERARTYGIQGSELLDAADLDPSTPKYGKHRRADTTGPRLKENVDKENWSERISKTPGAMLKVVSSKRTGTNEHTGHGLGLGRTGALINMNVDAPLSKPDDLGKKTRRGRRKSRSHLN
jgi:hypothetical protein